MNHIEYRNISKSYGEKPLIQDFNLSLKNGDFLCIVGSSGSGKTTLLKLVNGLLQPDQGEILIAEKSFSTYDVVTLRRKIGYVIQGNSLFPHLTVEENIAYVPSLEGVNPEKLDKLVEEMLTLVGLPFSFKDRYPDELSGGQQQRVGIARAYANRPEILLMDEPFGAVDAITRSQLQKDLKRIHQLTQCTIIFITHDMLEAKRLATHILVMDSGKVQQYGTVQEVFENPKNAFVKQLIDSLC